MQRHLAIIAAVLVLSVPARPDALNPNITSTTADIKIGKTIEVTKLDEPIFRNVICNFAITQAQTSQPSVILSGKVVSNNSGGAQEFVPLFFGSTLHPPRLVALTNADGEFRFRVWLIDKPGEKVIVKPGKIIFAPGGTSAARLRGGITRERLETISLSAATLYLEGKFNQDAEMISSYTHIYSLKEFLAQSAKQKP